MRRPAPACLGATAAIRAYLRERWPATAAEIAEAIGLPLLNVFSLTDQLAYRRELVREDREEWRTGHRTTPYYRHADAEGPGPDGPEARDRARRAALAALERARAEATGPAPTRRAITAAEILPAVGRPSNQVAGIDHVEGDEAGPGRSKPADRQNRSRS